MAQSCDVCVVGAGVAGLNVLYNLSLMADQLPAKVFAECGLDVDRWYPLPRRLAATARFMLTHRRYREHRRQALDTVRERFDPRCGPLNREGASVRDDPGRTEVVT